MTRFIIVRHGKTEAFKNGVLQKEEEPLNATGINQAKKLGHRLKEEKFDVILCSDALRAKQTCEQIHEHHRCTSIEYLSCLRERSWGIFKGTHFSESQKEVEKSRKNREDYRPEGGENFEDVAKRAKQAWSKITKLCPPNSNVLIVSHGTFISFLISAAQKIENKEHTLKIREKQIVPTTLNIIEVENDTAHLVCIGDTCHLKEREKNSGILEK
ncbi:MAG: histidine phosphatase family protein [Candidatus Aenigmarchaeota archaeon]|nr:histidine phosphatase family protein [Candidatus Aenigmarchaeota archaeon]